MQTPCIDALQRLYRLRFFHFLTALLAGPARIIAPEFEHCLAKMVDDVFAIEVDVFHQCSTIFAVENYMLLFARRPAALYNHPNRVRRALRRMRHVWRNEKRFALTDNVINDAIAFADPHLNVAFQLIEVLFRINEMKIVPRIGTFDDHHKKIAAVIKISVAYWRFKFSSILFNPLLYINRRLHAAHGHERISARATRQTASRPAEPGALSRRPSSLLKPTLQL